MYLQVKARRLDDRQCFGPTRVITESSYESTLLRNSTANLEEEDEIHKTRVSRQLFRGWLLTKSGQR
jgi:hypothetical protein